MSSLRERIEGLIKLWRNQAQLDRNKSADMQERLNRGEVVTVQAIAGPYIDPREVCAEELADVLAAEEQGDKSLHGTFIIADLPATAPSLHKEGVSANLCELCGKENSEEWWVEHELWERFAANRLMLCISCFDALAEQQGIILFWTARISKHSGGAGHKERAGGAPPNEIDLVRAVLCAHQTAFAKAHNGEGRSMMEAENIAIGYASVELAKLLAGRTSPAGRAEQGVKGFAGDPRDSK